ncbi:nitrogen fixation protein NifU [Pancytospora epiphaga]|nr:nitrogen fixation protein NifU [Pancytospora epiphaga]
MSFTGDLTKVASKYAQDVMDHFNNPRNVGSFQNSMNVGTGIVGAPACGDVLKFQIKVNRDNVIEDAKFKTFGCGSAIASSSLATEWVKGKTLEESLKISNKDIAQKLALPPIKLHCSMLAEDAIKSAIKDYQSKNMK